MSRKNNIRRQTIAAATCATLLGAGVCPSRPAFGIERPTVLFRTGDPAPGMGPGVTFAGFGQPVITPAGQVIFAGALTGTGIDLSNNSGLWGTATSDPSTLTLALLEGTPLPNQQPGTSIAVVENMSFGHTYGTRFPVLTPAGHVAFIANTRVDSTWTGNVALVGQLGQPLKAIAQTGQRRPDGLESWSSLHLRMNPSGEFALRDGSSALFTGAAASFTGTAAGSLTLLARAGRTLAGRVIEDVRSVAVSPEGHVFFHADSDPTTGEDRSASFATAPANVVRLITPGAPAPGTNPPNTFNRAVGPAYANSRGDFVVQGRLLAQTLMTGLWKGNLADPSNLTRIVAPNDPAPGVPDARFLDVHTYSLSDSGLVFLTATMLGPNLTSTNNAGIWMGRSADDLTLVSRSGGLPQVVANRADQALFPGRYRIDGYDPALGRVTLAIEGQQVEVAPGVFKTIHRLAGSQDNILAPEGGTADGQGVSLNDAGQVAFLALFTDNTYAILTTRIPVAGDATADGIVNLADFNALFDHFGETFAVPDRSTGDFNLDGAVGFADFQMLERHFGRAPPGVSSGVTATDYAALANFATTVPEPTTIGATCLALARALGRRKRRTPR